MDVWFGWINLFFTSSNYDCSFFVTRFLVFPFALGLLFVFISFLKRFVRR